MDNKHGLTASRFHRARLRRLRQMTSLVWPIAGLSLFTFFSLFVGLISSKNLNLTEALAAWLIYEILFISTLALARFLHADLQLKTMNSFTFLEQQRDAQSAKCFLDRISSVSDTRTRLAKNRSLQTLPPLTLEVNRECSRRHLETWYLVLLLLRAAREADQSASALSEQLLWPDYIPNDISKLSLLKSR